MQHRQKRLYGKSSRQNFRVQLVAESLIVNPTFTHECVGLRNGCIPSYAAFSIFQSQPFVKPPVLATRSLKPNSNVGSLTFSSRIAAKTTTVKKLAYRLL
jgi:hypothetical protein